MTITRAKFEAMCDQVVTEALENGMWLGRMAGWMKGQEVGIAIGKAHLLVQLMQKRFGQLTDRQVLRIQSASLADLDRWGVRVLDAPSADAVLAVRRRRSPRPAVPRRRSAHSRR